MVLIPVWDLNFFLSHNNRITTSVPIQKLSHLHDPPNKLLGDKNLIYYVHYICDWYSAIIQVRVVLKSTVVAD